MTRAWGIVIGAVIAASLVVSAVIVRDGLLAIAMQIRDKPIPKLPEQIHLVAGDSRLNISVANMSVVPAKDAAELNISIDNIHIAPTTIPIPHAINGTDNSLGAGKTEVSLPASQPVR